MFACKSIRYATAFLVLSENSVGGVNRRRLLSVRDKFQKPYMRAFFSKLIFKM